MLTTNDVSRRSEHLDERAVLVEMLSDADRPAGERIVAGYHLALDGWRPHDARTPSMVEVPGGTATIGTDLRDVDAIARQYSYASVSRDWILKEAPRHTVEFSPYRIGKYPVTCAEYLEFCTATGAGLTPSTWGISSSHHPADANVPVCGVDLASATAYCAWLHTETGRFFTLPTEAEWEYAAAGPDAREFPWGSTFDPDRANTRESGVGFPSPVGAYPRGASWVGALDMAGNVEEWTSSRLGNGYEGQDLVVDDLVTLLGPRHPICRGGSFSRYADLARCRRRHGPYPSPLYPIGFRLAEHPVAPTSSRELVR